MTDNSVSEKSDKKEDLTGKDRIVKNVLTGWIAYLIYLVAGFIMPRFIDNYEGQFALGIWDFSWTFMNYLSMSGLGLASALNRYVPRYRTTGEYEKLGQTVSTVVLLQILIAIFVMLASVAIFYLIPVFFSHRLGDQTYVASWVVLLLGANLAVEMLFDASRGVIAGYHRWDVVNGINSISRITSVIGMLASLMMGGGLISLAAVYLVVTCIFMLVRYYISLKICSDINVKINSASAKIAKEMIRFGLKTIVLLLPSVLLLQTVNMFIAASLGPAALAIFTRPIVLVKYIVILISRFSFVLTPTAGALQATGDENAIRDFILETTRVSVAITLPLLMIIAVYGDVVVGVWMGDDYINHPLIIILAIGTFLPAAQQTLVRIFIGMNMHGKIGLISFVVTAIIFSIGYWYIKDAGWTLMKAASLIVLSDIIGAGIIIPVYACKTIKLPFHVYLKHSFYTPVLISCIFLGIIVITRLLMKDDLILALFIASFLGGIVVLALYWKYLLSNDQRRKLSGYLKKDYPKG